MTNIADLQAPDTSTGRSDGKVARVRLNRPERKNPLTFEFYAELRDSFRARATSDDVKAVVF